jgi:hypothetical protein
MDPWAVRGLIFAGEGPVLLGAALLVFGPRLRPLSRAERKRSDEAARENWGKEKVH